MRYLVVRDGLRVQLAAVGSGAIATGTGLVLSNPNARPVHIETPEGRYRNGSGLLQDIQWFKEMSCTKCNKPLLHTKDLSAAASSGRRGVLQQDGSTRS